MTSFIDSHAHLSDPAFDLDRDAVIERARSAGAEAIVCIGESLDAAVRAERIARAYPGFCFHTAGVHPSHASTFDPLRDLENIRIESARGAVAIGECGLDYHYHHAAPHRQRTVFEAQLALAAELSRPVVVHTREAEDDTRAMIVHAGQVGVRGVLHCYTGSTSLAEVALDLGWYVSFSGVVTFRSWRDEALLQLVPADRLLAESDAPYLSPVPHRGKRNEPGWVNFTIAKLASARGADVTVIGSETAANARRFFALA